MILEWILGKQGG